MICGETRKRGGTRGTRSRGRVVPHRGRANDVSHPATVGIAFSQDRREPLAKKETSRSRGECAIASSSCVLAVAILSHPMSPALSCHGPEGWGPASRSRPFDLTPCFEEGAILSPLLSISFISLF